MPTYEFECESCGHRFEVFQGMHDPFPRCQRCESKRVRRLVSGGSGIIFKGTGFYQTDYKAKGG